LFSSKPKIPKEVKAIISIKTLLILMGDGPTGCEQKRHIVCSMFPEKLTFEREEHLTLRVNDAIRVFDSVKVVSGQKKDRKTGIKSGLRS
jgi:hypothetical protein